jgi:hypothetical protein
MINGLRLVGSTPLLSELHIHAVKQRGSAGAIRENTNSILIFMIPTIILLSILQLALQLVLVYLAVTGE